MDLPTSKSLYFAGNLFDAKQLLGNAVLAEEIFDISAGRILPILPQVTEHRELSSKPIRDTNLETLRRCDLALFNFEGLELDSGTVVEFVCAKALDIPSLILRTDFRISGDQPGGDPWNLMCSHFPRTRTLLHSSLHDDIRTRLEPNDFERHRKLLANRAFSGELRAATRLLATRIVHELEELAATPPLTKAEGLELEPGAWFVKFAGLTRPSK